ncbi:voltage-dependent calcium channel beta subunit-associated regulatory protein isoform X2 [Electrophorus electricus]|uniref:voltage-dependent calcium channel beta subunit-associated regulatory protein isoform X2 n=1 Tax=Electrophorus electricus TaxID=8005 RepID=UPI0015D05384|nr:voltage-dependent calcium channel beta subunit-associated regulatory protein isoform X2 [Electrophorus electricus]
MSDELPRLTSLMENTTDVPVVSGRQDNYVLLVMMCVFAGGTLLLLTLLLVFCHRCCQRGRRYSRASDDLEKTNTTYVEESQPGMDIAVRLDSSDVHSAPSRHSDGDTERFQASAYTGRRVSFNETAIYEHSKKSQEKGRRYTLTEGDFHHLKKARLTQLHISSPATNILTIMECDSPENSVILREQLQHNPSLSIFQPAESALPESPVSWNSQSPSGGLPGDTLNSVLDSDFAICSAEHGSEPPRSRTIEAMGGSAPRTETDPCSSLTVGAGVVAGGGGGAEGGSTSGQGTVLHFLSRLRRHASLEGASPYFTIKKWKFDSSHRAASLDMRGSPRRRAFQRQRAASETLDQGEEFQLPGGNGGRDFLLCALHPQPQADTPRRLSAGSLEPPTTGCVPRAPFAPPPPLSRLVVKAKSPTQAAHNFPESTGPRGGEEAEEDGELTEGATGGEGTSTQRGTEFGLVSRQESLEQPSLYRDIWSLRASLEQYASSDLSSNDRDSTRSDADSICSLGGAGASRTGVPSYQSQDIDDEVDGDGELPYDDMRRELGGRRNGRDSVDSEKGSDSESGSRKLLQMDSGYASIEAPCRAPEELRLFGSSSGKTASEKRRFFTSTGRKETVCESFETRLFKEEMEGEASVNSTGVELEGTGNKPYGGLRTSSRDDEEAQPQAKARSGFRRRDYSIDEKTEALFNEFLRHDPQFDQQGSPSLRHRHRSRIHLRKQWQRAKQYSDPGAARYSPSLERQRSYVLRRGDSANYPLDTRFHSTLPRIASAADEEASEGGASEGGASEVTGSTTDSPRAQDACPGPEDNTNNSSNNSTPALKLTEEAHATLLVSSTLKHSGFPEDHRSAEHLMEAHRGSQMVVTDTVPLKTGSGEWCMFTDAVIELPENVQRHMDEDPTDTRPSDKLASSLDERLYTSLRRTRGGQEHVVAVTHISPDLNED